MLYNIKPSGPWMDANDFLKLCMSEALSAHARMLVLSDGSLTRLLNAFLLSSVKLQRLKQEEITLDHELAEYIGTDAGQKVIDRDVWLRNNEEKLVYANSILPTSLMKGEIYNEINKGETPIGTLISEQSILSRRDKLQIAKVRSEGISWELGINEKTELIARRYRLSTEGGFSGAILEVFSPKLLGTV